VSIFILAGAGVALLFGIAVVVILVLGRRGD
jgi:hypothetical protein